MKCINCGEEGPHFVPPSLGEKGFFACEAFKAAEKTPINLPYPWCPQPEVCKNLGSCPRDPNCGD